MNLLGIAFRQLSFGQRQLPVEVAGPKKIYIMFHIIFQDINRLSAVDSYLGLPCYR